MWHVEAGSGDPVVFVHGALCDWRFWEPQLEAVGRTHRAIAVSLSGYHPDVFTETDEFSAERHILELGGFLASFATPVHLVGHSRGGRVALHVAGRFGTALRSVLLLEPGGEMEPGFLLPRPETETKPAASIDVRGQAMELIRSGHGEEGMRLYIDHGHGKGRWDRLSSAFRRILLANADTIYGMVHDRTGVLSAAAARAVTRPTLLLAGDKSPAIFGRTLDALESYMPSCTRRTLSGADHFVTFEEPAAFDAVLLQWLGSHPG